MKSAAALSAIVGAALAEVALIPRPQSDHFSSMYDDPLGLIWGDSSDPPFVLGRRGQRSAHVHVPNPRAEERKRRAVAEMQARKARKRAKSALSRAD